VVCVRHNDEISNPGLYHYLCNHRARLDESLPLPLHHGTVQNDCGN
jgi:hypothetical protein